MTLLNLIAILCFENQLFIFSLALSLHADQVVGLTFPPLHTVSSALLINSLSLFKTRHKDKHLALKTIMSTLTCLNYYNEFHTVEMW